MSTLAHVLNLNLADRRRFERLVQQTGEDPECLAQRIMRSSFCRLGSMNPVKKTDAVRM
jgi:hypothetical protein